MSDDDDLDLGFDLHETPSASTAAAAEPPSELPAAELPAGPLASDPSAADQPPVEEVSFEEISADETTPSDETLTGGALPFASDDADLGLDLDLAGDPSEPSLDFATDSIGPAAEPVLPAAEGAEEVVFEADELTFDLDEPPPLSLPDPEPLSDPPTSAEAAPIEASVPQVAVPQVEVPESVAPEADPAAETASAGTDALPLEFDDDLELAFDLAEPASADDVAVDMAEPSTAQEPAQAEIPAIDEPNSEFSFDLTEHDGASRVDEPSLDLPEPGLSPTSVVELPLDDDDLTFSLEEARGPDMPEPATPILDQDRDDTADEGFELAIEPDAPPANAPAASNERPTADASDPTDDADELFFDDTEPDPLNEGTAGHAKGCSEY